MNKLLTPHHTCGPPKAFPAVTLGTLAILLKTKSMSPPPYSLCHLLLGQTRPSLPLPKPFVPTSRPWPTLSLCLALLGLPVYPTGFAYRTPPHSLQPGSNINSSSLPNWKRSHLPLYSRIHCLGFSVG